ncbi:CinA family protein [Pedobacter frigiditerrae]|uniref:CinA family protein n=1 Tax=Pedobacter frigiditerrae TaxID=2530452 RepID=UPI002930E514|nr:CinA family protein [Pedobacter frigiditerrae]
MLNADLAHCSELLLEKELTVAFAESASAGRMVAEFAMVPNAGKFLKGGFVCYDACLKEDILKVPKELIEEFTPESPEVTKAITEGLTKLIKADIHIGVTGLPTPGGSETPEKPVGSMFICCIYKNKELFAERVVFDGEPEEIILRTVFHTAELLATKLHSL